MAKHRTLMQSLRRIFRPSKPPALPVELVLYTRQGCHLCEDAHTLLEQVRRRYPFQLALVDIDANPSLVEKYGQCVPVVTVNGKLRFRGRVNRVLLTRLLETLAHFEKPPAHAHLQDKPLNDK